MYILATGLNIFIYHNPSDFMTGTSIPCTVFASTNPVEEFCTPLSDHKVGDLVCRVLRGRQAGQSAQNPCEAVQ